MWIFLKPANLVCVRLIFLLGFLSSRKGCRFVHTFFSDHNLRVLKQHGLEHFTHDELCQLLLQNDPSLLPEVSITVTASQFCVSVSITKWKRLDRDGDIGCQFS